MKKFLFASDFDGTLCRDEGSAAADIAAIGRFRSAGGLFGIASGRGVTNLALMAKRRGIECDFLLGSTSTVCQMNGEILFSVKNSAEMLPDIYGFLYERGNLLFGINRDGDDFHVLTGRESWKMNGVELQRSALSELGFFNQCNAMFADEESARSAVEAFNAAFHGRVRAFQNGVCADIVKFGHDKATGISTLAEILGVERGDIFTAGDNFNDIPMLDAFRSFVVATGKEEVKLHATERVVDGVAEALDYICGGKLPPI